MAAKKEIVTLPEEEVRVEEEKVGEDLVPPLNIDPDNAEEPAGEAEMPAPGEGSGPEEEVINTPDPDVTPDTEPDNAEEPAGEVTPPEEPAEETPEKDTLQDLVDYYKNRYPGNKTFHITSDGMFFLEKDLNLAWLHQRSLSSGKIKSVTV